MRVTLERVDSREGVARLRGRADFDGSPVALTYATRTGALLRIDEVIVCAFDREHQTCTVTPPRGSCALDITVEERSLPTSGLPAGEGIAWRWMLARAAQTPPLELDVAVRNAPVGAGPKGIEGMPAVGHAHLDVAWLWTFSETKRKIARTLATALRQIDAGTGYVFAQSQPQLYAYLEKSEPALFARVRAAIDCGGIDASVAALWVESDCNLPSGESLLRQFLHGVRYAQNALGHTPTVAWLPDSFGFCATFPTLAAHAGVYRFATTKLMWNDTTVFPHPQFAWHGPDGSRVVSALLASYDGGIEAKRIAASRTRDELFVLGFGDGGGGARDADLASLSGRVRWTSVAAWLEEIATHELPTHTGELYLEFHRGVFTTRRALKVRNAGLERALEAAEEAAAWCVAVRAPSTVITTLREDLQRAWTIVLRNQFHDIITGTATAAVYSDVYEDYDKAERIVARTLESAQSILPRVKLHPPAARLVTPRADGNEFDLANAFVRARIRRDGTIVDFGTASGPNVASVINGLRAYVDKPKKWDAWNIDRSYAGKQVRIRYDDATIEDEGLVVRLRCGDSPIAMRLSLAADEPWLRVELAIAWNAEHVLLRSEHWLATDARAIRYGAPHGTVVRTAYPQTPAERAKFEAPGHRYAALETTGFGFAQFVTDSYGWSARGLEPGIALGHSLLRATNWPAPRVDRGEQHISYALVPTDGVAISGLEQAWLDYAHAPRVRLFSCEDPAVLIVAAKPAEDGDGVIVRVRECDGQARPVELRSGGRARAVFPVDAVERSVVGDVRLVDESLHFTLPAFGLRSFRVTF